MRMACVLCEKLPSYDFHAEYVLVDLTWACVLVRVQGFGPNDVETSLSYWLQDFIEKSALAFIYFLLISFHHLC